MSITTTIKAGELGKTITLPEGKVLTVKPTTGASGTAGVAYLLDQVLGGTNSNGSWIIGNTALAPIGAYEGTQKILINCTAGSIDATVGDAVLVAPTFDDVNAMRSPSGKQLPLLPANSFAMCGTSREMMNNAVINTNAAGSSVTAGILTVSANGHQRIPGERVNIALINTIGGVVHQEVNKDYTVLDLVDANNFRVDLGDPSLNGAVVGSFSGGGPFQYMSLRDTTQYGWWNWLQAFAGDCVDLVDNFAIGGVGFNTVGGGILAQIDKAIATGAANIIIGDPINDIQARVLTEDQIWANFKAAYNKCRAANRTAWAVTCAHLGTAHNTYAAGDSGYTNFGHHTNLLALAYNKRLKNFAKKNTGIVVLYIAEPTTDPASATGEMYSAVTVPATACTADGIHFQAYGARKAGGDARNVAAITSRFARIHQQAYCMLESRTRQGAMDRTINSNALFNDGVESSGLGAGWAVDLSNGNISAVRSTVARTFSADGDAAGRNQQLVITATGSGNCVLRSLGATNYTVADVLRWIGEMQVTSMSGVSSLNISLNVNMKNSLGVDTTYNQYLFLTATGYDNSDLPRMKLRTRELSWPSNFSAHSAPSVGVSVQVAFSGAGGATLLLGNAPIEKIQPL